VTGAEVGRPGRRPGVIPSCARPAPVVVVSTTEGRAERTSLSRSSRIPPAAISRHLGHRPRSIALHRQPRLDRRLELTRSSPIRAIARLPPCSKRTSSSSRYPGSTIRWCSLAWKRVHKGSCNPPSNSVYPHHPMGQPVPTTAPPCCRAADGLRVGRVPSSAAFAGPVGTPAPNPGPNQFFMPWSNGQEPPRRDQPWSARSRPRPAPRQPAARPLRRCRASRSADVRAVRLHHRLGRGQHRRRVHARAVTSEPRDPRLTS